MGVPVIARHRACAGLLIGALCAVTAVALAPAAAANPPGPHDPVGTLSKTVTKVPGGIAVHGWAADPDDMSANVRVAAIVDGNTVAARGVTALPSKAIANKHGTGPTPVFQLTVPVAKGNHTVCIVARNVGQGVNSILKCVATPLGSYVDAGAHSPVGAFSLATASSGTAHFGGWATDPDYTARRSTVVLYIDNHPAATVTSAGSTAARPKGAGKNSAWTATVAVSSGAHLGCVWVVNVGFGSNSFLGCEAVDTRGAAGSGALTQPAANKTIVKWAKKQIGKPYVWGASGPKSFDCSGLVDYAYAKAGMSLYHQSEVQFAGARLIPASRAVPGDLVFYHDTEGDVYHVGIYLSPGKTVAAIDESQGVDYQTIWDPSSTTYGSFTHT